MFFDFRRLSSIFVLLLTLISVASGSDWEYNPGPNPDTAEGRELLDIYAELPEYMAMSQKLMDAQKFRYIFGMMMTRAYFEPNSTKILFVGQDATHIAEAAKQPGTSGFGARVQSIGNYFGVDEGVATTNAFLSTIKGQYGSFDHPYVEIKKDGSPQVRQSSYVDNDLWMLANGSESEIRIKREAFWEWELKNHPESLRLIAMFGGAARDSWAEFLIARGAKVGTRLNPDRLKNIRVPMTKLVYAGGNNEFPVPIDRKGRDIYEKLLGKKPDYTTEAGRKEAFQALKDAGEKAIKLMVFTGGGIEGSGILNPAQLGGYDLEQVEINGVRTNSLKGLVLSDGTVVKNHVAFAMSAHPSKLSKMKPEDASAALKKSFMRLNELKALGWRVEPDFYEDGSPRRNLWDEGEDYEYGRADIRPGYFEFGAPDDRRVSRADASRLDPQVIVVGTRKKVKFDDEQLKAAKESEPAEKLDAKDLWSVRPRQPESRYVFDRGPGAEIAQLLVSSINREELFAPKPGMQVFEKGVDVTFEKNGINAYYTKTHPGTGLFGFHRGSFEDSRALILADPHGLDDWNTARALTGARGQYLDGLMRDLGFGDQYLVLKTVPVGMDGADEEEWEVVRKRTEKYREAAIQKALENGAIELILADGPIAKKEIIRVLKNLGIQGIPVVAIERTPEDAGAGILEAGKRIQRLIPKLSRFKVQGQMTDIPRRHLPWWARHWEGRGGDHVVDALGKARGGVRALVAPNWVAKQRVKASEEVQASIAAIRKLLRKAGLRLAGENVIDFLERQQLKTGSLKEVNKRIESCEALMTKK